VAKFQADTILTSKAIGKAVRPLFADPVTHCFSGQAVASKTCQNAVRKPQQKTKFNIKGMMDIMQCISTYLMCI